jgi:hypothetical protein
MSKELALFGRDLFGDVVKPKASGVVAKRFTFPPFSVLDARGGEWQARKRAWKSIGIRGEVGRTDDAFGMSESMARAVGGYHDGDDRRATLQTSVFDPVVCELAYQWFSPPGGQVVDPFAGGSVRGLVAGALGRRYWGCDLRAEQIAANEGQAGAVPVDVRPAWVCGDSADTLASAPLADLVFSCPPYGNLEVYSDDPSDLSAQDWPTFLRNYRAIVRESVARLRPDRFACFVVGDFRDRRGNYRNFVGETVRAFLDAGCSLYNEAAMITPAGTAGMRVSRQFAAGRKFAKTHQNVLVFVKGDGMRAAKACGPL